MDETHYFEPATFSKFTYCDHCTKFIWGLSQQGLECQACHYCCHYHCKVKVNTLCPADGGVSRTPIQRPTKRALNHIRNHLTKTDVQSQKPTGVFAPLETSVGLVQALESMVVGAALDASQRAADNTPVSDYLSSIPPWNPSAMTRNFTRFVGRCGVIFSVRRNVILLVNWDNPLNTWIAILVYNLICLQPQMLVVIPYLALLYLVLTRKKKIVRSNQGQHLNTPLHPALSSASAKTYPTTIHSPPPTVTRSTPLNSRVCAANKPSPQKQIASTLSRHNAAADATSHSKVPEGVRNTFIIRLPLRLGSEDDSPEYRRNLQHIQHMMGEFSDVYDAVIDVWKQWTGDDNAETLLIRLLVGSLITGSILACFVPINYIYMATGNAVFCSNTRFAKAMKTLVMQDPRSRAIRSKVIAMTQQHQLENKAMRRQQDRRVVSMYENQRYNTDKGYIADEMPGPKDRRTAYSNFSGSAKFSSPSFVRPPKGFQWATNSTWRVDETGPWQEPYLGVEVVAHPDKDGWIYTDDYWKFPLKGSAGEQDLGIEKQQPARRRRWVRECVPVQYEHSLPKSTELVGVSDTDPFL